MARNWCAPTVLLCLVTATGSVSGQTSSLPAAPQNQILQVELTKSIRANKAKFGDVVKARAVMALILNDQTVIPEGSELVGHVLRIELPSGGSGASSLTIAFEELRLKHGLVLRTNFSIRAVRLPQVTVQAQPDTFGGDAPSSSWMPHSPPRDPALPPSASNPNSRPDPVAQAQLLRLDYKRGDLRSAPEGTLIGMPGVTLRVDGVAGTATFRSASRKLELKSGLQLAVRVEEREKRQNLLTTEEHR